MPGRSRKRRLGWDDYFLRIADDVALRADCTRRQVGAVLVGADHRIIETGYNGSPPGEPGCLSDGACPRGRHYRAKPLSPHDPVPMEVCACGVPWPCAMAVPAGSSYDTGPGACISIHAEINALLRAGIRARGSTLYLTDQPCDGCWRLIRGAGVTRVVWPGESWTQEVPESALRKLVRWCRRLGSRG